MVFREQWASPPEGTPRSPFSPMGVNILTRGGCPAVALIVGLTVVPASVALRIILDRRCPQCRRRKAMERMRTTRTDVRVMRREPRVRHTNPAPRECGPAVSGDDEDSFGGAHVDVVGCAG